MAALRAWFAREGFLEAEPGALTRAPGAETHIDAFETRGIYLHTSPEFAMKKLLAAGEENIFFLGKAYRAGERGPLHAPEFTLLEWYRAGAPYERIMEDCVALVRAACEAIGADRLAWRGAKCDPYAEEERLTAADAFSAHAGQDLLGAAISSEAFSRLLTAHVEPRLGQTRLTMLREYPLSEAALARRCVHDPRVAERFELYACGVELANGFGELTDPVEQRTRLEAAMAEKLRVYGQSWPIDADFLAALAYMPPASGCALGVDRLVMLASGATHIDQVLWTPPP